MTRHRNMRCPTLAELPSPPHGKIGWPWTIETPQLPSVRADGTLWPRISIATPSYNQGQFIEETIRSVLLQGYPNLEYMIIDGGSTDETVDIIRRYEKWLAHWVSEKDRGQPHAINKGLTCASGALFNWINSDDLLLPRSLQAIGEAVQGDEAIAGSVINFTGAAETAIDNCGLSPAHLIGRGLSPPHLISSTPSAFYHQPGIWLLRENISQVGGIDDSLQYCFDFDLILRYLLRYPSVRYLPNPVARFRLHDSSKTVTRQEDFHRERMMIYQKILSDPACAAIHRACSVRLRTHLWWEKVDAIRRSNGSNISRALQIILAMFADPRLRFSRLSLGAVKQLLLSGTWSYRHD